MSYTKSVADHGSVTIAPQAPAVVDLRTLAEAQAYLKTSYGTLATEDTIIKDLIQSARTWIEEHIGQSIIGKTITAYTDDEINYFVLPMPPVLTVTTVHRIALDGSATLLTKNSEYYEIGLTGRAVCTYPTWSTMGTAVIGLKVVYETGMSEIPKTLKEACLSLVSHMYYNRGANMGMPADVIEKLRPFRKL